MDMPSLPLQGRPGLLKLHNFNKLYLNNSPADKLVLKDGKETKQERATHTSK